MSTAMTQVKGILQRMLPFAATLIVALVLFYGALWLLQERFIYFPRRYPFQLDQLPPPIEVLRFRASGGAQTAFYVPPRGVPRDAPPKRLWLVFGGNAMTALDWSDWALTHPDADAAFLLVEYPGYGASEGAPSQLAIAEVSDGAFAALAAKLREPAELLAKRSFVLGHSMGAATGLEFATRHPVGGVVLTAPFSTIGDVAARLFGPPVRLLLRERYDNVARLGELALRGIPVTIIHGHDDEIIAFALGERLAQSAPWARFVAIPRAHHNDLYEVAMRPIRSAMLEASGEPPREAR